jgi:predicted AAA+ superfamily ATPase
MLDILKTLITDFQEAPPDPGKPRNLKLQALLGKASVCIGVRRCGKSTLLFQTAADLLARGVSPQNLLYLNFFDDRLRGLANTGPGLVLEAYYSLFPDKKGTETVYCFFDEIQEIPGWEAFVSRLLRTERCEVFLTGSSATMLSKEIATQMRGRALSWELFPLSFPEYLAWKGLDQQGHPSSRRRLQTAKAFDEYWQCGGFPEVIGQPANLRTRIHQEYFHTVLARDLVERHDLSHPRALTDLAVWLLNNAGSMYSLNRLSGYLKALGHKVPKASVAQYLDWLEDAFFLFPVKLFERLCDPRQRQPQEGLLCGPRPGCIGVQWAAGELGAPSGEPGLSGVSTTTAAASLLQDPQWEGS